MNSLPIPRSMLEARGARSTCIPTDFLSTALVDTITVRAFQGNVSYCFYLFLLFWLIYWLLESLSEVGWPHRRVLRRLDRLLHQGSIKAAFFDQDEVSYYCYAIFIMLALILVPRIVMGGREAASTVSTSAPPTRTSRSHQSRFS